MTCPLIEVGAATEGRYSAWTLGGLFQRQWGKLEGNRLKTFSSAGDSSVLITVGVQ